MRKIVKFKESIINSLQYNCKDGANNKGIGDPLLKEQKNFCAYSEEYIDPKSDANDIEHFNPDLKCKALDSYQNWFKVKRQINFNKRRKENEFKKNNISFENILHPCDPNFENKLQYVKGEFRFNEDPNDEAVTNLINLLELNLPEKIERRRAYINRKKKEIYSAGLSEYDFFEMLISDDVSSIKYLRTIQEEFEINIWEIIPEIN